MFWIQVLGIDATELRNEFIKQDLYAFFLMSTLFQPPYVCSVPGRVWNLSVLQKNSMGVHQLILWKWTLAFDSEQCTDQPSE